MQVAPFPEQHLSAVIVLRGRGDVPGSGIGARAPVADIAQWHEVRPFDRDATQAPGSKGAGIDIRPVGADVGSVDGCVPVHDEFFERQLVMQKLFAYPEEIVFALLIQGDSRPYSRMGEKEITAGKGRRQGIEKCKMLCGHYSLQFFRQSVLIAVTAAERRPQPI